MATRWKKWTELFQTEKRNWRIAVIFFLLSLLIGGFVFVSSGIDHSVILRHCSYYRIRNQDRDASPESKNRAAGG